MHHQSSEIDICPSFNSYAMCDSAQTAARVAEELSDSSKTLADEEDDFEFDVVIHDACNDRPRADSPAINQDQVRNVHSIFSVSERNSPVKDGDNVEKSVNSIRNSLSDLFFEDRDPPSCSSSDAEDAYCIWSTKPAESSSGARCKKSNSTGSRRLKFLSFIRRSNSEGKNSFVFMNPSSNSGGCGDKTEEAEIARPRGIAESKVKGKKASSAHEIFYAKNREGGRRRSYLPYRQDLVGIFSGFGKDRRSL